MCWLFALLKPLCSLFLQFKQFFVLDRLFYVNVFTHRSQLPKGSLAGSQIQLGLLSNYGWYTECCILSMCSESGRIHRVWPKIVEGKRIVTWRGALRDLTEVKGAASPEPWYSTHNFNHHSDLGFTKKHYSSLSPKHSVYDHDTFLFIIIPSFYSLLSYHLLLLWSPGY